MINLLLEEDQDARGGIPGDASIRGTVSHKEASITSRGVLSKLYAQRGGDRIVNGVPQVAKGQPSDRDTESSGGESDWSLRRTSMGVKQEIAPKLGDPAAPKRRLSPQKSGQPVALTSSISGVPCRVWLRKCAWNSLALSTMFQIGRTAGENIFRDEQDRACFLQTLAEACTKAGRLAGACLPCSRGARLTNGSSALRKSSCPWSRLSIWSN